MEMVSTCQTGKAAASAAVTAGERLKVSATFSCVLEVVGETLSSVRAERRDRGLVRYVAGGDVRI